MEIVHVIINRGIYIARSIEVASYYAILRLNLFNANNILVPCNGYINECQASL